MTKKLKWRNRLFWIRILIMILVLAGSYCAYAFIYRGRNEPPAKRKVTNQEAAYYTLRGQIQMLSQKEELWHLPLMIGKKSGNTEPISFPD